jgi:cytochrome P450
MPHETKVEQRAPAERALRTLESLNGPRGLPFFGNLFQIEPTRFHQIVEGWSRQYGDLFRIQMGRKPVLVTADPEVIGKVLRDRPAPFGRGTRLEQVGSEMGISGLFGANGDAWRRQRSMVMSAFAPGNIKRYFPSLVDVTQRLERRWRRAAASGSAIDLQADLMRFTVDVTAGLAFGAEMNTLESEGNVIQEHLDAIFPMLGKRLLAPIPYWRWFKLAQDRALEGHLTEIHRSVEEFINQARQRMAADPSLRETPGNLIEALIAARDTPGSELNDSDVAGNVLTMLLAGEDTTANTLAWLIHLVSQSPQSQVALQEEAERILGADSVAREFADAGELAYAEACAHETMRLKSVAPILILEAYSETEVAGVSLAAGTLVMLLTRQAATDARSFSNSQQFLPQRWLAEGEASGGNTAPRRASMPFGGGPRLCPGRYLALLEIKMVVSMLFRNFEILAVTPSGGGPVRERLSFTMEPVGLQMKLRAR